MEGFTLEQAARWDAWQHANAISAGRSDRVARLFGAMLLTGALLALAIAIWR
jgi:hypothetical protein